MNEDEGLFEDIEDRFDRPVNQVEFTAIAHIAMGMRVLMAQDWSDADVLRVAAMLVEKFIEFRGLFDHHVPED